MEKGGHRAACGAGYGGVDMWYLVILLTGIVLGLSRRRDGRRLHLTALAVVVVVIAYASLKTHAL